MKTKKFPMNPLQLINLAPVMALTQGRPEIIIGLIVEILKPICGQTGIYYENTLGRLLQMVKNMMGHLLWALSIRVRI